jgi:hypothetical protein
MKLEKSGAKKQRNKQTNKQTNKQRIIPKPIAFTYVYR